MAGTDNSAGGPVADTLIVGAGAVGGSLGAFLARAGHTVAFMVRPESRETYEAVGRLRLTLPNRRRWDLPAPPIVTSPADTGAKRILLAVKHGALETALDRLAGTLSDEVEILSCLNGVGALPAIRRRLPKNPSGHLTIMYNATVNGPMAYTLTTRPMVMLQAGFDELKAILKRSGLIVGRGGEDIAWGKLLFNLNNAICALTDRPFRDVLAQRDMKAAFLLTLDEAIDVIRAAQIPFRLPIPVPYGLYRGIARYAGPLPWWFARLTGTLTAQAQASMLQDIRAGRATEIRELNGVIAELARRHGRAAPVNERIVELVEALERQRPPAYLTPSELRRQLQEAAAGQG